MPRTMTFYEATSWHPDTGYKLTAKVDDEQVECFVTPLVFEDHFQISDPDLKNTKDVREKNIEKFKNIFRRMIIDQIYKRNNRLTIDSDNFEFWSSKL